MSCLNPWDVQSKHVMDIYGVAEALYAGECRYGGVKRMYATASAGVV